MKILLKKKKKKNAAIDYGVFIKNFQFIKGFCYTVKIFIMHTHQEVTIVYLCLSTKQELKYGETLTFFDRIINKRL